MLTTVNVDFEIEVLHLFLVCRQCNGVRQDSVTGTHISVLSVFLSCNVWQSLNLNFV